MTARNIKLTIRYDGTGYHGWQVQPDADTVQGRIADAFETLTGQSVRVNGSSRTDAGVHAQMQVANVHIDCPVPTENFVKALNQRLPRDIAITEAVEAEQDFDAISDTVSKRYRYTIYTAAIRDVMGVRFCWHRRGKLDVELMSQAAGLMIGRKDFKSFASAADERQSSVRTIIDCAVSGEKDYIYIDVQADGFLYNMVRNIVGTLVEVGRGRWSPEKITEILQAKERAVAGQIAPAAGLCLMEIEY